jgi:L-seryl-tRNA(Ser) seleniumtransferase
LPAASADRLARGLRAAQPPVIGRIENGRVVLDPRTVLPDQEDSLLRAVQGAMTADGLDPRPGGRGPSPEAP